MPFRIIHLSGSLEGRVRVLNDGGREVILGRDPQVADVVFGPDDRLVSRRHASLKEQDGVLLLRDLGSSTGTFLDGESIEEAELAPGDVFELGRGGPRIRVDADDQGTMVVDRAARPPQSENPLREADPEPPLAPGSHLQLTRLSGPRAGEKIEPGGSLVRLGRASTNTLAFPEERIVSAQHAKIVRLPDGFVLMDLESTNGTLVNGQRVERARLHSHDVIALGPGGPELSVGILAPDESGGATIAIPNFAEIGKRRKGATLLREIPLPEGSLTLGRADSADVCLPSPIISKAHARLTRRGDVVTIEDLGSTNGTYVDGQPVERQVLGAGDRVILGPFQLETAEGRLRVFDTRRRAELVAHDLGVTADGRRILDAVSLTFLPGSLNAIIGPSGSGKSTLLRALNGARPAAHGRVLVNSVDLYASAGALRGTIGYVPQDDIVHAELTPAECLEYTARLRLPPDTRPDEKTRRIAEVLATLELTERQDVPVGRLSGGQRKRVSIAVELLTEPDLLFLDEPTSGLDPGLEEALMLLLRELAFKGKTVVIVTHTLEHIHFCDLLVLLVSGRTAFCGKPDEARRRFRIAHMAELYTRLKERPPAEWAESYRAGLSAAATASPPAAAPPLLRREAAPSQVRQMAALASRYARTLTRDTRNTVLLLAQAPLVAGLIGLSLLYGVSDVAYTKPKNTILFLLALTAVWFGCSNAVRELVKERAIFLREQMAGLKVFPYVLSKLLVLSLAALVQCAAFLLILDAWFGIPGSRLLLLLAMWLAAALGLLLGLLISAVARTADRAMTLLPILLIPQVLFTFPSVQLDMKGPAGLAARAMPTWWSYDLLRRIALAPDALSSDDEAESRLADGKLVLMTKSRFESMLREGFPMWNYRNSVEITWTASAPERWGAHLPEGLGYWRPAALDAAALLAMAIGLLILVVVGQVRATRPSG